MALLTYLLTIIGNFVADDPITEDDHGNVYCFHCGENLQFRSKIPCYVVHSATCPWYEGRALLDLTMHIHGNDHRRAA